MITPDDNRLLTESGPETPGGRLLRSYWQPAALTEEVDRAEVNGVARPVIAVKLLGEDLVLYREPTERAPGERASYGLLDRACAHRRADLTFGRLEDGGLRCPFHGWLFDRTGACRETPAEPDGSTFCTKVRQRAYPVVERNGIIWAWMGEGDPPPLPGFDALVAPSEQVFAFKGRWECNWLQAQEVGIDPAHASFLHRFLGDVDEEYGLQFRATIGDTGVPTTVLMREVPNPTISLETTSYGFRLVTVRDHGLDGTRPFTHVRITNCLFPNAITIPMSADIAITQWHVPIDDTSCYWYSMFVSYGDPVDGGQMRAQRIDAVELPGYRPRTNRANAWGYDPAEQHATTYTGMGTDINVHDQWAVESPGVIHDRSREHLSPSDVGIRTQRRMMLAAMAEPSPETLMGSAAPSASTGPAAVDAVAYWSDSRRPAPAELETCWREHESKRRAAAPWAVELSD
jgi:phenylpropionate dioxygenase-like ring-hydroxylating dioxygenase large terminal subunit